MPALRFTCAETVVAVVPAAAAPPPTRHGRRRACFWRTAGLVALVVVVAVAAGLVLTWPAWAKVPADFGWRAFDAGAWRSADPDTDTVRGSMVRHLVLTHRLDRMTRGQVLSLLGPPTMSYAPPSPAPSAVEAQPDGASRLDYQLGYCRCLLCLDPDFLTVEFDDTGRVARWYVRTS